MTIVLVLYVYSLCLFKITSEEPILAGKLGVNLTGATGSHHTYTVLSHFSFRVNHTLTA